MIRNGWLIATWALAHADLLGAQTALPAPVQRFLDATYPGWHFAGVAPEYHRLIPRRGSAAWIGADFDGDGRTDYAVQLVIKLGQDSLQQVIAFVRRRSEYLPVVVDSFPVSTIAYLAPARSGEERVDFDADANGTTRVRLRHDSIDILYAEVGATTCRYEAGRFRCFVSGD